MPSLIRFVMFNVAAGTTIGVMAAAVLVVGEVGPLSSLGVGSVRFLGFFMLALTLGPAFGLGCLATALCLAGED